MKRQSIGCIALVGMAGISYGMLATLHGMKWSRTVRRKVDRKGIALTFDDGPNAQYTPQLLDLLKKYGIKATFFVVGEKVEQHPELVKRMHEE